MWPQNPYGQPQYPQQPYQYNQPPQMPYSNAAPMNNNNHISTEAIDWDEVASIDPDLIRMTGDLTQLQPFISKFVSSNLSAYESQILTHPLSIRLCSILQVSLRYMSDVQKEFQSKIEEKDRQIIKQQHEFKKLAISYAKADELLRKQMKPSERCPLCLKRFKNFDFLDQHIERRHAEHLDEWLSIRNKKTFVKQNQNDINNIMERIDELQKSIRRDREKRGRHHNRRGKSYNDNDENIQTLHKELHDQQDHLMATEAIEDELLMTKREDMKSELDSAVDDLNASWIAWSNNKKSNQNKNQSKNKKQSTEEDELNNMYNIENKMANNFDNFEDQFEMNDNFGSNCHSVDDDLSQNPNFNENQMNQFQFQMIQENGFQNQQQNDGFSQDKDKEEESKSKKKSKKTKHSLFGRKKSKHIQKSEENQQQQNEIFINNNNQTPYSNLNESVENKNADVNVSKSSSKSSKHKSKNFVQNQVQLPPKKKTLPDDVKELIAKARKVVVRKFNPVYDESTVQHVMKSIEKKMNGFKQQFSTDNNQPEQVAESLQSNLEGDQNEYFATRRKVMLKIENEAPVKHCTLFDSSFSESSAISTANLNDQPQTIPIQKQVQQQKNSQPIKAKQTQNQDQQNSQQTKQKQPQNQDQQQQQQNSQQTKQKQPQNQQNVSQSSISAKNKRNKRNTSINIDDIPKPNNSQFTTSYSNYASQSVSTTISPSNTPINDDNKQQNHPEQAKSSYSYIISNSNINEPANQSQSQDQNQNQDKPIENEAAPSNTKKIHIERPRQQIQCKKHFKSAGHSVHSPYPMLSTPTVPEKDNKNDVQTNNQEEVEYVYEEEEEETPENDVNDQDLIIEEEEEIIEPTSAFQRPSQSQSQSQSQPVIQSETVEDSFDESKFINDQSVQIPKFNNKAKNEITSSTDIMLEEIPQSPKIPSSVKRAKNEITSSTDTMPVVQQNNNNNNKSFDSLDESNSVHLQLQKEPAEPVFKTPPNNNVIYTIKSNTVNNNVTESTQYEYEYYSDEEGIKSDGEVVSNQQQKEEIKQVEKIEQQIEQEEIEINSQIKQEEEKEKSGLEPFIVSSESQQQIDPEEEIEIKNPMTNMNQNQNISNQNLSAHSDYYSSSSTNLFYKFDSSTNSKSRTKEIQDEIENDKNESNEIPVKQTVYQTSKVGSMDNIVSFDEVKSIESIENIRNAPNASKVSAQATDDSQFNFDSFVEKSNGGDSFISESSNKSHENLFGKSIQQQQQQQQSIDPSSYNISSQSITTPPFPPTTVSTSSNPKKEDSFISKQRNILASKYGVPPPPSSSAIQQKQTTIQTNTNNNNNNEYEEEEEEDEYEEYEFENENKNQIQKIQNNSNSGLRLSGTAGAGASGFSSQNKFNAMDIFKQPSNSSFLKNQKSTNKMFMGSKIQKTFAGSSSAGPDEDEFDYSRGPPMKGNVDFNDNFNDEDFGGDSFFSSKNKSVEKESSFKTGGLSKFVYDSEGPPTLSKKKDNDSLISNDDFNL